jgi:ABC-type Mn2+/Zn2+ transport system permease subunit
MLPLVCGVIFSVSISGGAAPAVGYIQPFLYGGAILGVIGTGLLQLFDADTKQATWVGITFLTGLGFGAAFQMVICHNFQKVVSDH